MRLQALDHPLPMLLLLFGCAPTVACSSEQPQATHPPEEPAKTERKAEQPVPPWAGDARWYQIAVPAFENGDLDSVRKHLPYLKELGVNTLYLTHVFAGCTDERCEKVDQRHIDDALGVRDSRAAPSSETNDPGSWKFSGSDGVFLGLVKEAHAQEFRIVVDAPFAEALSSRGASEGTEALLLQTTRRWLDPDGDGNPADGIDGWVVRGPEKLSRDFWVRWREHAKKVNPSALLVCDVSGDSTTWLAGDTFDVAVNYAAAEAIRRFLAPGGVPYSVEQFLGDLTAISTRYNPAKSLGAVIPLSWGERGRLFAAMKDGASNLQDGDAEAARNPTTDAYARWRLAVVLHFFYLGAPMAYCGDEGENSANIVPASGRSDPQGASADERCKIADYRGDFASLIKWLNIRRQIDAPIRLGDFRAVMSDEARHVFAFARSLPGNEAVLVVNYGDTKQRVILQVGKPGELVGVLSPALDPLALPKGLEKFSAPQAAGKIRPLRMGGSRQYVDTGGHVRLSVDPMSVRVVLIKDDPTG